MRSIKSPREKEIKITVLEQKILRVNLSEKSIVEEYIPVKVTEKYIGGQVITNNKHNNMTIRAMCSYLDERVSGLTLIRWSTLA